MIPRRRQGPRTASLRAVALLATTPAVALAQDTLPAPRVTIPPAVLLGAHVGAEAAGDVDHRFVGARATIPVRWRSLVSITTNWHAQSQNDAGEATLVVRVHPLPSEIYVGAGVGLWVERDVVSGDLAFDGEWLAVLGLQARIWRVWPYLEAQVVDADAVVKLLGGIAVPLRSRSPTP